MRLALILTLASLGFSADFDLMIRNARVVDGSGNPWFHADIGIQDGKIAAIGNLAKSGGKRVIDARGLMAAPGFIDVHTHIEGGVEKVPGGDNYVTDGVTTVVTGNCGGSVADLASWFAGLEKLGIGLNVASLVGHNTVRRSVMGTANRLATPDEIAQMKALIAELQRKR